MSQIRMSLCIVVSALVAATLVAGQSWDGNKCTQSAQRLVNDYNRGMSKAIRNMVSRMSKHGTDSANIEGITSQANSIMENLSQFADTENMTDMGKISSIGQQTLQAYIKLGSSVFKTQTITEGMRIYSEFGMEAAQLYTKFVTDMITVCGPSSRSCQ